jgi:hypothetical protein
MNGARAEIIRSQGSHADQSSRSPLTKLSHQQRLGAAAIEEQLAGDLFAVRQLQ